MIGAGCEVYGQYRVNMPDPSGTPGEFLRWFNILDKEMLKVCRGG